MNLYLLLAAVVIIVCVLCNRISSRFGIPMLLAFILLGMAFGSDGILHIPFEDFKMAEQICSVALIFIMFYGGFGTKWSAAKPVIGRAVLLSTAGVALTALFTGLFCHFALHMEFGESFLIGSLISSTDAASVFSILRSRRLNLKYHTASLLEVESGSNDPCAYMLTTMLLAVMGGGELHAGAIVLSIAAQVAFGLLGGVLVAYVTVKALRTFKLHTEGFDTALVFGMALLSYALPSMLGGNGYLSVYMFGILLGNSKLKTKKALVHFFDGITGLMQMLLFFLLGLLAFPSRFPMVVGIGLAVALFLTFVARPLVILALLGPFRSRINQQIFLSAAGLRGAASIVFAIMAVTHPAIIRYDVFHIVFFIVLFSILIQGTLLPFAARKLDMIDEKEDVLKTFTDYAEEAPVQFIEFRVKKNHPWAGSLVKDILLPPETLLVQIRRKDSHEMVTPDGNTMLNEGDKMVLSARANGIAKDVELSELLLSEGHAWIGKRISEIDLEPGRLVVMALRGEDVIIPNGGTLLHAGDILVIKEDFAIASAPSKANGMRLAGKKD